MKIALVDDDPRALAQLEQYLTEQLGRETEIFPLRQRGSAAGGLAARRLRAGGAGYLHGRRHRHGGGPAARAGDGQVRLAFATSSNDFASESYEVGACYYLRKPFRPEGVRAMLERLDLEALERSRRLRLPDGSQVVPRSIRYAASDGHRVTLHCKRWGPYPADLLCRRGAAAVRLSVLLRHLPGRGGELPRGGRPAGGRVPAEGRHPSAHQPPEVTGGAGGILRLPL